MSLAKLHVFASHVVTSRDILNLFSSWKKLRFLRAQQDSVTNILLRKISRPRLASYSLRCVRYAPAFES